MSRVSYIVAIGTGIILIGVAASEHSRHRVTQRRYQQVMDAQGKLEGEFREALITQGQLASNLKQEQERSRVLSDALNSAREQLDGMVKRLANESQSVRDLNTRLLTMRQQMDQLQGELAVTLQDRQAQVKADDSQPVQLERVVVSDAQSAALQGRVISVHKHWNFVVVDLGWNAVRVGDTVSIFRKDELLARARVDRVQEGVCAATILPDWKTADVQVNDVVRAL